MYVSIPSQGPPWPTGERFDLGCYGFLYCYLRSCVLAVRWEVTLYYELFFMCLKVAMSFCRH